MLKILKSADPTFMTINVSKLMTWIGGEIYLTAQHNLTDCA